MNEFPSKTSITGLREDSPSPSLYIASEEQVSSPGHTQGEGKVVTLGTTLQSVCQIFLKGLFYRSTLFL